MRSLQRRKQALLHLHAACIKPLAAFLHSLWQIVDDRALVLCCHRQSLPSRSPQELKDARQPFLISPHCAKRQALWADTEFASGLSVVQAQSPLRLAPTKVQISTESQSFVLTTTCFKAHLSSNLTSSMTFTYFVRMSASAFFMRWS